MDVFYTMHILYVYFKSYNLYFCLSLVVSNAKLKLL